MRLAQVDTQLADHELRIMSKTPQTAEIRKSVLRTHVRTCAHARMRARDARARTRALVRAIRFRAVGILTALIVLVGASAEVRAADAVLDEAVASAIALVRSLPLAPGARLEVEALPFDPRVAASACATPLVAELVGKRLTGARASVRVRCTDKDNPWSLAVALRIALFEPVLIARRALVRGDTIDTDNTELAERDVLQLGYGHLDDPARYAGARVLRPVAEGAALAPTAVAAPLLVERGSTVTLLARGPAIDVRAAGIAIDEGSAGMRVRVRNVSSGRTVNGIVDGPGQVSIER